MAGTRLTDDQWARLAPLLRPAPQRTGRPRADDRRTLEAILVLRTGCRWQDLAPEYGAPTTAWERLRAWEEAGVYRAGVASAAGTLDAQGSWSGRRPFSTGALSPRKRGSWRRADPQGEGTKLMLATDGEGTPIGFLLASANRAESALAGADARHDPREGSRSPGPPRDAAEGARRRPGFRQPQAPKLPSGGAASCPGSPPSAAWGGGDPGGRPRERRPKGYERRWIIERSFAWLLSFRRVVVRWERRLDLYRAFCLLALILICLRRVSE